MDCHYKKHAIEEGFSTGNNVLNYTDDAINYMTRNSSNLQYTYNYKYNNTSWNLNYNNSGGGEFTGNGKIITFWYRKK